MEVRLERNLDVKVGASLGFWAVIFQFLTVLPFASYIAGILSWVFLFVAHKKISKGYQDKAIFRNTALYFVLYLLGIALSLLALKPAMGALEEFLTHYSGKMTSSDFDALIMLLMPYSRHVIVAVVLFYISFVAGVYFLARAYHAISYHSGLSSFATGGNLLFYGAMGTLVLGLGFLVMLVGWVVTAVAYRKLLVFQQTPEG